MKAKLEVIASVIVILLTVVFAMSKDAAAVVLEPDVAAVFNSSESVNTLLRSVIAAMPESKHPSG